MCGDTLGCNNGALITSQQKRIAELEAQLAAMEKDRDEWRQSALLGDARKPTIALQNELAARDEALKVAMTGFDKINRDSPDPIDREIAIQSLAKIEELVK